MATEYPVPAFRRLRPSWDDVVYNGGMYLYDSLFVLQGNLPGTTKDLLDKNTYSGTPVVVPDNGGLFIKFSVPTTVHGYLLDLVSGLAPEVLFTRDTSPVPGSGTWLTAGAAQLTPVASHRTPTVFGSALSNVTGLIFQFSGAAEIGNLHLYGLSSVLSVRMVQLDGVTPVTPDYLNFGTGGKDGWRDIQFRFLNVGVGNITSMYFEFQVSDDPATGPKLGEELFVSVDSSEFRGVQGIIDDGGYVTVGAIPVGSYSDPITIRRNTPTTHDNSSPYEMIMVVYPSGSSNDESYRLYLGDCDVTKPQPQLWHSDKISILAGEPVDLTVVGAGATSQEFSSMVLLSTPQVAPSSLSIVSWTPVGADPALGNFVDKVDYISHRLGIFEPMHYVVRVLIPAGTTPGLYNLQVLLSGSLGSNQIPLRVVADPSTIPTPQDGFRLQATTLSGTVLASNVPYESLSFTDELSDVGAAKLRLDFSSPFWTQTPTPQLSAQYVADNEFVWQIYEGNSLRFSFLNTFNDDTVVDSSLARTEEIQSEGIGSILSWSVVAPPKFPVVPPYYWSFAHARLWQWLTIWAECVKRTPTGSAQRRFIPTFTRYTDSAGNAWLDPGFENQQKNGINMLELLKEHCDSVGADFRISPDFKIHVIYSRPTMDIPGKYFGMDRKQFILRSSLTNKKTVQRDRSEIANWIIAQDDYGEVTLKYDNTSIAKNGMRERFVEAGRSGRATTRASKAAEELKWYKDASVSWNISVPHYYVTEDGVVYNRAFVDYQVGDWVYLDVEGSSSLVSVQIQAITVSCDSRGRVEMELTLESLAALRKRKAELQDSLRNSGGSGAGGSSLVLFEEEIFPVESETPGTSYEIKYLPLPKSEIITLGMRKYMEVDGSGGLAVREFTRTLRRGEHWERTGWVVTITDPSVFDEAF